MEDAENNNIEEVMVAYIRKDLKWTHRELHDALLVAEVAVPPVPSIRNYMSALFAQYGNVDAGFLPQSFKSHTKAKLQNRLRMLGRTGLKLGGKVPDKTSVLAEQLVRWLNRSSGSWPRSAPGRARW